MKDSHSASLGKTWRTAIFHTRTTQYDKGKINQKLIQLIIKDAN